MVNQLVINPILLVLSISAIAPFLIAPFAITSDAKAEPTNIPQSPVEPSLWWKAQRLQAGWVDNIVIKPETRQAIVKINTTRWGASDYLQRFSFLFKLGTEAQKHNFNVLLYNRRDQKIAEYSTIEAGWRIDPTSLGAEPFRVVAPSVLQ